MRILRSIIIYSAKSIRQGEKNPRTKQKNEKGFNSLEMEYAEHEASAKSVYFNSNFSLDPLIPASTR